ncbi:MAG: alkaline phosphatase D [Paraglaciecola sp.]|jgi:alkaline phosphatase D
MNKKFTRREALIGASSVVLLGATFGKASAFGKTYPSPDVTATYQHGIASGDPDTTSVVIWTRVSNANKKTAVTWRMATDSHMQTIKAQGQFETDASRDYTVKVVVENLQPGESYFYQFDVDDDLSVVGQTKTLPVGHVDSLVLAVATCSNYPFGYFNAYDVIANDSAVDVVVHLGDYIYEYGQDGYGGETGKRIGRNHEPAHEILTLADYRQRHGQYKTDVSAKAMHARHPMIVLWDDHESANNPWMGGAENHQQGEGDWGKRRAESLQAFYEWLPIRDPANGGSREDYWRHYKFGDLLSLITLETRHTGRSQQIEMDEHLADIKNKDDAQTFIDEVVGASDRHMLSGGMEQFLAEQITESVDAHRRWRVIGSSSVIGKRIAPDLSDPVSASFRETLTGDALKRLDSLTHLGSLGLPVDLDSFNGYPAAREDFYQISKEAGAQDLLVISGDSHSYWQNELYDATGHAMGVELGATGVTSPRSLLQLGKEGLKHYDEQNALQNPEVVWTDGRYRGFIRLEINHDGAHADFITVSTVESPSYDVHIVRSVDIEPHQGTLRYK